jgi:hypothetical protein
MTADKETETVVYPVCPFCNAAMELSHYEGYYEDFAYWSCECENDALKDKCSQHWAGYHG